ncbi:MAG: hypothetical protein L0099_17345 [Acidobacteria bacterium]|nr:hypothetical protein [Acidobacteriota bacterium]
MKNRPWLAPVAAAVSSVIALACCLPLGFLAALGLAGAAFFLDSARPWLAAVSVALLALGLFQFRRQSACGIRHRASTLFLFWAATIVVVVALLAPQLVAGFLADYLPGEP